MAPIIEHADIRRSLLTMKALTQAARAICLVTAKETDVARRAKNEAERAAADFTDVRVPSSVETALGESEERESFEPHISRGACDGH